MAEVALGAVAFAHQLAVHANDLRRNRNFNRKEAPEAIDQLVGDINTLYNILAFIRIEKAICNVFHASYATRLTAISTDIGTLVVKLRGAERRRWDRVKYTYSRGIKDEIDKVRRNVRDVRDKLHLDISFINLQMRTAQLVLEAGPSSAIGQTSESSAATGNEIVGPEDPRSLEQPLLQRVSWAEPPRCLTGECRCSCHNATNWRSFGRYWGIESVPLSILFRRCDNEWCSSRDTRLSIRLSLSKFGIPFAIIGQVGPSSIRPALKVQRTVKYTSPVFEALWYFREGIETFQTVKESLMELHRTDGTFNGHIDPSGRDCFDVILMPSYAHRPALKMIR